MKKTLLALLLMAVFAVPVLAQMHGMEGKGHMGGHGPGMEGKGHTGGHGPGMGMGVADMDKTGDMLGMCVAHADKLGLTDDQAARFKAVHRSMQKKQVRSLADQKIAEIDLVEIMEVKDFDIGKATAVVQNITEIKTARQLEMLKTMKEARNMLTDKQFQEMKKTMHGTPQAKKTGKATKKHHK